MRRSEASLSPSTGNCPNVAEALRDAAVQSMKRLRLGREARPIESLPTDGPEALANVLAALHKKAADSGCDQVVLLWDEFGRHLESLLREGRASTLAGHPGARGVREPDPEGPGDVGSVSPPEPAAIRGGHDPVGTLRVDQDRRPLQDPPVRG